MIPVINWKYYELLMEFMFVQCDSLGTTNSSCHSHTDLYRLFFFFLIRTPRNYTLRKKMNKKKMQPSQTFLASALDAKDS